MPESHSIPRDPEVYVGVKLEFTGEEMRRLEEASMRMLSMARQRPKGWIMEFVRAYARITWTLQTALRRSHASVEPERGPGH